MGVTIFVLGGLALCGAGLLLFWGGIIFLILTLKGLFDTKKIHISAIISVCIGEILFVPLSFAVVVGPLHMLFFEDFVTVLICVIASCALIAAGITLFAFSASSTKKEGQRPLRLFIPAVILFCTGIYFSALFGMILSLYPVQSWIWSYTLWKGMGAALTLTGICLFGICKFKTKDNEKLHKKLLIAAIIVFCTGIFLTALTFFSEAAELVITAAMALATAPGK